MNEKTALSFLQENLSKSIWFFDFDGSLVPHVESWQTKNYDSQDVVKSLLSLKPKVKTIYWNTGRRSESLFSVNKKFSEFSGFFVQGSVFFDQQLQEDNLLGPLLDPELVTRWDKQIQEHSSVRFEVKPTSCRIAPMQTGDMHLVKEVIETIDSAPMGWSWHLGERSAELLYDKLSKGTAVEVGFSKNQNQGFPVAVGDDVFDMLALRKAVRLGGMAIVVGDHLKFENEKWDAKQVMHFKSHVELNQFLMGL